MGWIWTRSLLALGLISIGIDSNAVAEVPDLKYNVTFARDLVGVAFSPYVKDWIGDNPKSQVPWDTYTVEDIKIMLRIISTKFNLITSYGMGVAWSNGFTTGPLNANNTSWDKGPDANCLIGKAASQINSESNRTIIQLAQGIAQNENLPHLEELEIQNALASTREANGLYPGTVWGIIFFINYPTDVKKGLRLLSYIRTYKDEMRELGAEVGTRLANCHEIEGAAEFRENIMKPLVRELDFILCNMWSDFKAPISENVQNIWGQFNSYKKAMNQINPKLKVILGETGWPSAGKGNHKIYNLRNMREFWVQMNQRAENESSMAFLFEAFNEPWKSDANQEDPNAPDWKFGKERHFGWWRRESNDDPNTYIEKIQENDEDPFGEAESDNPESSPIALIIGLSLGILGLMGVLVMYLVYRLRAKRYSRLSYADIKAFKEGLLSSDNDGPESEPYGRPYDKSKEISKDRIHIDKEKVLGSGAFGVVYKGYIDGLAEDVAFKTVREDSGIEYIKGLLAEIKIMIYIGSHPYIIGFIGAYTADLSENKVYLAAEFCAIGSLEKHLRNYATTIQLMKVQSPSSGNSYINFCDELAKQNDPKEKGFENLEEMEKQIGKNLLKWSWQIADGMEFLASKKIIHADLATRNTLLTGDETIKISDFGLSRKLYEYTHYVKKKQEPLPWRWMAIESLRNLKFSTQSDIWAFGVTLWEIFSLAEVPYPGLNFDFSFVDKLEIEGLRNLCPKYADAFIYSEMCKCWKNQPEERPAFTELSKTFLNLFKEVSDSDYTTVNLEVNMEKI